MTFNVGGVWPQCNAAQIYPGENEDPARMTTLDSRLRGNERSCQDRFSGRIFRTVHLP